MAINIKKSEMILVLSITLSLETHKTMYKYIYVQYLYPLNGSNPPL